MNHLETIQAALEGALRRRRFYHALRGAALGLLIGATTALLVLAAYLLLPSPAWLRLVAAVIPPAFALAGAILGAWRKPGLQETARWVDNHQHLKERLSTALELARDNSSTGPWRDLVLADAAASARDLEPARLLPFHLPRTSQWAALLLAVVAGLGFIPEYRSPAHLRKIAERENIRQVSQQLAELTRHSLEKRPPALERTEEALQTLANTSDDLTRKNLERSEALRDLANVADKLKEQLAALGKDPALKNLEQAARSSGSSERQNADALQKQVDALKESGAPQADPQKLDQLKRKLDQLKQQASAAKQGQPMSAAEQQQLSDSLAAISKAAQELGLNLPDLDKAMAALAAQQTDLFVKDLQAATTDLEKLREMAKSLQQLEQALAKIGKDLPEQLKNGQAAAAKDRLEKMVKDLASAGLKPEDLQKLTDEVARAADPAGEYGKLSDLLKDAARQMKQGDKPGASQSLAAAAKELENLMQQMGDAEQLMAAMEQLKEASTCIGTGQGWCAGTGGKPGQPGYKPGGKPGSGVGDWADGTGNWDGDSTSGWDNSGVQRPDLASRSSEKEGESPEGLAPSKVRGQFSPGGQMPSISLKGVSIKGLSSVNYQEAAAAAQTDADAALSQEKVPRAYQGAVRDYFNDLK